MYTLRSFNNPGAMEDYLNGAVISNPLAPVTFGLDGLTLIITASGSKTVTFSDASGAGLTPRQILDQILAVSGLGSAAVLRDYGYGAPSVCLAFTTIGHVVTKDGTANAIFGFSTSAGQTVAEVTTTNIVAMNVQVLAPLYSVLIHTS